MIWSRLVVRIYMKVCRYCEKNILRPKLLYSYHINLNVRVLKMLNASDTGNVWFLDVYLAYIKPNLLRLCFLIRNIWAVRMIYVYNIRRTILIGQRKFIKTDVSFGWTRNYYYRFGYNSICYGTEHFSYQKIF